MRNTQILPDSQKVGLDIGGVMKVYVTTEISDYVKSSQRTARSVLQDDEEDEKRLTAGQVAQELTR